MNRSRLPIIVAGALALAAAGAATAQSYRSGGETFRIARASDWDPVAPVGHCRVRVWVDDRAQVRLHGDRVTISTLSGNRSFDEGTRCNQPVPAGRVENFRASIDRGRGSLTRVEEPHPGNGFTGMLTIADPQPGGASYLIDLAWDNAYGRPLASAEPYPYFNDTRACQDRVRGEFAARNPDGDASLDFTGIPARESLSAYRDRIVGEAYARNRYESRVIHYECTVNPRDESVVAANYEVGGRRFSAAMR